MEEKKDIGCGSGDCAKDCGGGCCKSGSSGCKGESYGSRLAREAIKKMDEESKKPDAKSKGEDKAELADDLDPVIDFIVECVANGKNPISVAESIADDAGIMLCGAEGNENGKNKENPHLLWFLMNVISSYTAVRAYREVYNNGIGTAEAVNMLLGGNGGIGNDDGVEVVRKIIHIWSD